MESHPVHPPEGLRGVGHGASHGEMAPATVLGHVAISEPVGQPVVHGTSAAS